MKDLRIWHLSSNRWNSAITEYALSSVRATLLRGARAYVTFLANSPAERRSLSLGLEGTPLPSFGVSSLFRFRQLETDIRPDLIVVYGGPETTLVRARKGTTKVVRFRGQDLRERQVAVGLRQKLALSHVDLVMAPSQDLVRRLKPFHSHVECVPLGCDQDLFDRTEIAAALGDRPMILHFGRLDPIKGHGRMMEIMAALLALWPEDMPRPVLHVVGQPANLSAADIAAFAKGARLVMGRDVVLDCGRVSNVAALYSRAAVTIVPSLGSEIICRVAEESLLCGTPVVVSGAGSLEDVLYEGAGASYRGQTNEQAARTLRDVLISSLEESERVKMQRRDEARRRFSLQAMGERLESVFAPLF